MEYVKSKRDKTSICNICRQRKPMSWDHIPPKGGIELTPVEMETVFHVMTRHKDKPKMRESQNGLKYRTICRKCNEILGQRYDPVLNEFSLSVGRYLKSRLELPKTVKHPTRPGALIRAILGHLLAAKIDVENTPFDQEVRDFVFDEDKHLPREIFMFYWPYPYEYTIIIRDFAMFVPRGKFGEPALLQTLKYFPIAYLVADSPQYEALPELTRYRDLSPHDEVEIPILLYRVEHPYWPEMPDKGNVFFGGQSAMQAVVARRKSRNEA